MVVLSLSLAFATETCGDPFAIAGSWTLPSTEVVLDHGVLQTSDQVIAHDVIEAPAIHGDRVVFVQRRADALRDLVAWDASTGLTTLLVDGQSPNQPAISPDGTTVAFVNGPTGITAVYTMPLAGGEPVQHTNRDLVRVPGQAPEGFVGSPVSGFHFEGGLLTWEDATARHTVRWQGGVR